MGKKDTPEDVVYENDPVANDGLWEDQEGWEEISSAIWKPEGEGDSLEGMLDGFAPFTEGDLETEVLKYFIRARDGIRYSMVGGSVFDRVIEDRNVVNGDLLKITFQGKREISGGRSVNLFRIQVRRAADMVAKKGK